MTIDPRFDPAFQRGYEGVVDAPPPLPRAAATPVASPRPEEPDEYPLEPAVARAPEPAVARAPQLAAPGRNPFLIALIAVSVVLIVGGIYLAFRLRDLFAQSQGSANFDYITLQTLTIGAPIAIGLGVATAIGVLFVYAARWGRSDN